MCHLCNGTPLDHLILDLRDRMQRYGWTSLWVEPDPPTPSLSYTMGLIAFGHPELVLSGASSDQALEVLTEVADRVVAGAPPLLPGTTIEAAAATFLVVDVDPGRLAAGLLAWWPRVVPTCACHRVPVVVQLVALDASPGGFPHQLRLDVPAATSPRLDRAERRRQARRRS